MSNFRAASRYAKSLIALAQEQKVLEEVFQDMQQFHALFVGNRDFALMLKNPIINHHKKKDILQAIFHGKVHSLSMSFFDIITKKGREAILGEIAAAFQQQYNHLKGIESAHIITAVPINAALRQEFIKIVKEVTGKQGVDLKEEIDEDLIGGFILKLGDRQIDDSVQTKLKSLRLKLSQNQYIKEF